MANNKPYLQMFRLEALDSMPTPLVNGAESEENPLRLTIPAYILI